MELTLLDIEQQQFSIRFRGYAAKEVDAFLELVLQAFQDQQSRISQLESENQALAETHNTLAEREQTAMRAMHNAQINFEKMHESARNAAELIIGEAEVRAEKILNRAHNRLAQLHNDINELKRQRLQIELQIRHIIENHVRVLEMKNQDIKAMDEEYAKVRLLKYT